MHKWACLLSDGMVCDSMVHKHRMEFVGLVTSIWVICWYAVECWEDLVEITRIKQLLIIYDNRDSLVLPTFLGNRRLTGGYLRHECLLIRRVGVRYWITDGSLTTPSHSAPSLLHLQSPSLTHLHPISIPSLTPLHSSLFPPCLTLLSLPPCFTDFCSQVPWSSISWILLLTPFLAPPCFMLVPLFLVPELSWTCSLESLK